MLVNDHLTCLNIFLFRVSEDLKNLSEKRVRKSPIYNGTPFCLCYLWLTQLQFFGKFTFRAKFLQLKFHSYMYHVLLKNVMLIRFLRNDPLVGHVLCNLLFNGNNQKTYNYVGE